jgi:thymidylate synthase
MHNYTVTNVNIALPSMLQELQLFGVVSDSRNGKVMRFPEPVAITYVNPTQRVLFDAKRNANPFFHFFESLWMLAGRNDVAFVAQFVARMRSFSDDGQTFHGAYGFRWREHFGYDQLHAITNELCAGDGSSRRAVLAMWDANQQDEVAGVSTRMVDGDLGTAANGGKDVPCNTHIYFEVQDRKLNMMVCNRSNDLLWGALGANVVHMSMLQEFIANSLRVEVGTYTQLSNNMHVYLDVLPLSKFNDFENQNLYLHLEPSTMLPLIADDEMPEDFEADLQQFFDVYELNGAVDSEVTYITKFFNKVVDPMVSTWQGRNSKLWTTEVETIGSSDWRIAVEAWLQRRAERKLGLAGV